LLVREDFLHSSIDRFTETYGSISDEAAAKAFFKQWMQPRLSEREIEKIKDLVEKKLKTRIADKGKEKKKKGDIFTDQQYIEKFQQQRSQIPDRPLSIDLFGAEPRLPTSVSKPYQKIKSEILENMLWKRYWYKSRAQQTIIQYLTASRSRRPVWALMRYPVEWYIEDEIEDLDIETSMDEGPFIPEVTTLKWVEEPTPHGQSLASGYIPSALIVLDVSRSMADVRNEAAVAAYIAYLSARRAGGQTAIIVFSTGFVSTEWDASEELKELSLTMEFGEFTVFPTPEVSRLVSANIGPCFVVIITDGGWQNVEEAVPALEHIVDAGHKLVIFLIKGKEYQDRIELIKRTPDLRLYKISDPEVDLQGLTLSESMKTYKTFLW
ncbi:MAG: VWA domain-containing protein, partial [Candidatus Bathyarchaeia archaeon]